MKGRDRGSLPSCRLFLGPGFRLGARWNRLGETVKTRKKREFSGKKWARYGLRRLYLAGCVRASAVLTASFWQAFNDSNADVRKAVVFCLVDIYMVLGPQFEAHLGELNASQVRCAPFGPRFPRLLRVFTASPTRFQRAPSRNPGQENHRSRRRRQSTELCRLLLLVVHALSREWRCCSCGWCGSTSTA